MTNKERIQKLNPMDALNRFYGYFSQLEKTSMTNKEQVLKLIEGRIETMQTLAIESIELIYNAGYNEGVEAVIPVATADYHVTAEEIRRLKK